MKIICIGRNYSAHARERNNRVPDKPLFFLKPDSALLRKNQDFFIPNFSSDIHHEIELVVRINRLGKNVSRKFAHRYYNQVALGIDFTARDIQQQCKEQGLPWEIAKAFDKSAPISEFVPLDNFSSIENINFRLEKNGTTVQKGNSGDMLFHVDELINHISQYMTLKIGDLIYTGTPAGVGPVAIGDHLQGFLEDQRYMNFYVK